MLRHKQHFVLTQRKLLISIVQLFSFSTYNIYTLIKLGSLLNYSLNIFFNKCKHVPFLMKKIFIIWYFKIPFISSFENKILKEREKDLICKHLFSRKENKPSLHLLDKNIRQIGLDVT